MMRSRIAAMLASPLCDAALGMPLRQDRAIADPLSRCDRPETSHVVERVRVAAAQTLKRGPASLFLYQRKARGLQTLARLAVLAALDFDGRRRREKEIMRQVLGQMSP